MSLLRSRSVWGFAFYDFANSAYILIVHAFLFPIVFQEVIFSASPKADFLWGLALALSVLIALILGPWLGHRADTRNRKSVLVWTISIAFAGLLMLSFPMLQSTRLAYFVLFLVVNAAFVISQIVYDSFLPLIGKRGETSSISGLSWGFGYVGGVLCLIILQLSGATELESAGLGLAITAVFYIAFSLVSLQLLPKSVSVAPLVPFRRAFAEARIGRLVVPLVGIWLINEAIDVFIFFGPLFARVNFDLTVRTVGIYLLVVQLIGFPATWFFGWLGRRVGILKTATFTILIWIVVAMGASLAESTIQLLVVAILGSLVIGSTQALLRAYYSNILQREHSGLSFGFYSIAARSSAIIGPLTYGLVSFATGSQRIAMAVTVIPFLVGIGLLLWHHRNDLTTSSADTRAKL